MSTFSIGQVDFLYPLVDLEVFTCLTSQSVICYMYSEYTNYYTKEERI